MLQRRNGNGAKAGVIMVKHQECHWVTDMSAIQWNLIITRSLGPWKLPCYIRFIIISGLKKQRNIKRWDPKNYLVIRGFCYIQPLYNEVPLYKSPLSLLLLGHVLLGLHIKVSLNDVSGTCMQACKISPLWVLEIFVDLRGIWKHRWMLWHWRQSWLVSRCGWPLS